MQTATLDEFFAEVVDGTLERVPFAIPTPHGERVVYVEEIDVRSLELWRGDCARAGQNPDAEGWDPESQAKLIVRCVTDEQGKPFFKPEHVARLAKGRARYIDALGDLCLKVNRIGNYRELKKSSEPGRASGSCSASAEISGNGTLEPSLVG